MFKKYHLLRDSHDHRDHYVEKSSAFKLSTASVLPPSIDLRPHCSPIENQGTLGSCTGNAIVGAMEYLENKSHMYESSTGQFVNLSRLFVYYNERNLEHTVQRDAGAFIADGVKTLHQIGICTETVWPYQIYRFAVKPSPAAYADAATRKISAYARVDRNNGIEGIKRVLASGYPIVFGFTVFESFESEQMAHTGVMHMPSPGERNMGGHAVLMVGYDDTTQRVIVRNSWGSQWGQNGYFTMPYEYVTNRNLANDLWTITK